MKLYTINATPVRGFTQLTHELQRDIRRRYDTLTAINRRGIEFYADDVARVLSNFGIDGFTIYKVDGYWKGKAEQSFKIEIALDDETNPGGEGAHSTAEMIAMELRDMYNQEAVMLTLPNNEVEFI